MIIIISNTSKQWTIPTNSNNVNTKPHYWCPPQVCAAVRSTRWVSRCVLRAYRHTEWSQPPMWAAANTRRSSVGSSHTRCWLTDWLNHSLSHWLSHWVIGWVIGWLIDSLILWLVFLYMWINLHIEISLSFFLFVFPQLSFLSVGYFYAKSTFLLMKVIFNLKHCEFCVKISNLVFKEH